MFFFLFTVHLIRLFVYVFVYVTHSIHLTCGVISFSFRSLRFQLSKFLCSQCWLPIAVRQYYRLWRISRLPIQWEFMVFIFYYTLTMNISFYLCAKTFKYSERTEVSINYLQTTRIFMNEFSEDCQTPNKSHRKSKIIMLRLNCHKNMTIVPFVLKHYKRR